jgi:cytochrome c oxidase cbb3-type subunit III
MRAPCRKMVCLAVVVVLLPSMAWSAGDAAKGKQKYQELCAACHGQSGKGDGPTAAALPVKPRDHTDAAYMGKLTDQQIFTTIKQGGEAVGKSPIMPKWGGILNDQQIDDLVGYIRTLSRPHK